LVKSYNRLHIAGYEMMGFAPEFRGRGLKNLW
jgi:hypothetical protein